MDGVEKERGRIKIDERLRVPGMEGVFAMGDAAVNPDNPLGPLAQVADQQGKVRELTPCVWFLVVTSHLAFALLCMHRPPRYGSAGNLATPLMAGLGVSEYLRSEKG